MNDTTPQNVTAYLTELENELVGIAPDVRNDILAGVREELLGLDPAAARTRITELGDPAFIAAEARAEDRSKTSPAGAEHAPVAAPGRTSSIAAITVLIAGSVVVPVIGAIIGLVWVSFARAWTRREKIMTWAIPAIIAILLTVLSLVLDSFQVNGAHLAILLAYLVFPIEGIVLAIRGQRREWRLPG